MEIEEYGAAKLIACALTMLLLDGVKYSRINAFLQPVLNSPIICGSANDLHFGRGCVVPKVFEFKVE